MICDYCKNEAELVTGQVVHPHLVAVWEDGEILSNHYKWIDGELQHYDSCLGDYSDFVSTSGIESFFIKYNPTYIIKE